MHVDEVRNKLRAMREERRLDRQFVMISRKVPGSGYPIGAVRPGGGLSRIRIPIALLLILGGLFSFLPVLGIWMLPLGLLLLAVDLPVLRRPVNAFTIKGRRWAQNRWRKNRWAR